MYAKIFSNSPQMFDTMSVSLRYVTYFSIYLLILLTKNIPVTYLITGEY